MTVAPLPDSLFTAVSVLDSLVRAGMRHVVLSPGSRSAPLTYAVAALDSEGAVTSHVRMDERVAGFTALGIAKRTEQPVGVVTTSGTAVGELLPAVMEAYHSGVPLVVLSADRPLRLRGSGANQTTLQLGIFSHFVRAQVELENYPEDQPGKATEDFSRVLASLARRDEADWNRYSATPRGPVHINLAFDTPLVPSAQSAPLLKRWAESLADTPEPEPLPDFDRSLMRWLQEARNTRSSRTVVIAADGAGSIAQRFAQKQNLPLLAEPSSGARFSSFAIPAYRKVLETALVEEIERVVLFGHPTLSRPVSALLADDRKERIFYSDSPVSWFEPGCRGETFVTSIAKAAEFAGVGSDGWLETWQVAGAKAHEQAMAQVERYRKDGVIEGRAAGASLALSVWQAAKENHEILVCGSSNLIRDLDVIAPVSETAPEVYASRGLAGIDGTLATASGISLATARRRGGAATPVRVLVGDLTFLHDAMALNIGALELRPRLEIDVFDDCGGGIFSTLEHGELGKHAEFAETVHRYFTTPHAVNIDRLVTAFSVQGVRVRVHLPRG